MTFGWPEGFSRIPKDSWVREQIDQLALDYDSVQDHSWYSNLDRTVEQLREFLQDGFLVIDYSGGTGILTDRLLRDVPRSDFGIVVVDSSRKFLRLALEKFRQQERVALRLLAYQKQQRRLQGLDEVLELRAFDCLVSTNAIHLCYGLPEMLASWREVLRPGGRVFVQSGNIDNPQAAPGEWIIDRTVEAINLEARRIVRDRPEYSQYRSILDDAERSQAYDALRQKYFLPVRPLDFYLQHFEDAGLRVLDVSQATIEAEVEQWYTFLSTYHEGVLGWVGGVERIEGVPTPETVVQDRLAILQQAMQQLFDRKQTFVACWTYIICERTGTTDG